MTTDRKYLIQQIGIVALGTGFTALILAGSIGLFSENQKVTSDLQHCKAEATAWYNANAAQADATSDWFLAGQPSTGPDYTLSQKYVAEANSISCIYPTPGASTRPRS